MSTAKEEAVLESIELLEKVLTSVDLWETFSYRLNEYTYIDHKIISYWIKQYDVESTAELYYMICCEHGFVYSRNDLVKNLAVAYLKLPSIIELLQQRQTSTSSGVEYKKPLTEGEHLMIKALTRFMIEQPSDTYAIKFKPILQTLYKISV